MLEGLVVGGREPDLVVADQAAVIQELTGPDGIEFASHQRVGLHLQRCPVGPFADLDKGHHIHHVRSFLAIGQVLDAGDDINVAENGVGRLPDDGRDGRFPVDDAADGLLRTAQAVREGAADNDVGGIREDLGAAVVELGREDFEEIPAHHEVADVVLLPAHLNGGLGAQRPPEHGGLLHLGNALPGLIGQAPGVPDARTSAGRAVEGVVYKSGAKEVYLMEEVMAAAIGSGIKVEKPEGSMIVDLGGGTSEMAVLSLGGIVVSNAIKVAGERLDKDIVEYIKRNFNVIIGEGEAEEVKKQIGAATSAMTEDRMNVKGRNLISGLPETITVTTQDINDAMKDSLNEIIRIIKLTLEQTPPELASDIMENGIVLSGGLSFLKNIDMLISEETGMPVFIAENPDKCVIKGVGSALDNIEVLKKATKTKR